MHYVVNYCQYVVDFAFTLKNMWFLTLSDNVKSLLY